MNVTLRQRKKGNKISLYLDYYSDGKREYEYLNLYLLPEPEKGKLTKEQKDDNRKKLSMAEAIRSKRLLEIKNEEYGFRDTDLIFRANKSTLSASKKTGIVKCLI